jgi:hypothetical protein
LVQVTGAVFGRWNAEVETICAKRLYRHEEIVMVCNEMGAMAHGTTAHSLKDVGRWLENDMLVMPDPIWL